MLLQQQQHRIPLKGHDDSIDLFTKLLRDIKEVSGSSSADVIVRAIRHWKEEGVAARTAYHGGSGRSCGTSRPFYLQLLSSPELQAKINADLETLRDDQMLKSVLGYSGGGNCKSNINCREGGVGGGRGVGKNEFLLEALIVLLMQLATISPDVRGRTSCDMINKRRDVINASDDEGRERPKKRDASITSFQILDDSVRTLCNGHLRRESLRRRPLHKSNSNSVLNGHSSSSSNGSSSIQPLFGPAMRCEERSALASLSVGQVEQRCLVNQSWVPVHNEAIKKFALMDGGNAQYDNCSNGTEGNRTEKENLIDISACPADLPILTLKERQRRAEDLAQRYLQIDPGEVRETPGFEDEEEEGDAAGDGGRRSRRKSKRMNSAERARAGADCDLVYPGIFLGSGATVKNTDYLRRIGVTHVLNAAEFRGVGVGKDFFKGFRYLGLRLEDTPQTQICRHFPEAVDFIDGALRGHHDVKSGHVFVNCVFGRSRSAACVVAFLMVRRDMTAEQALATVRRRRPVQLNPGFLAQIVDLDHKLAWIRRGLSAQSSLSCSKSS